MGVAGAAGVAVGVVAPDEDAGLVDKDEFKLETAELLSCGD